MDAEEVNRSWDGLSVCVAGLGVSGRAAARVLAGRGARVTVVDARDGDEQRAHAAELEARGSRSASATARASRRAPISS